MLPGLLRFDKHGFRSLARQPIGIQVERLEGEIGMAAGGRSTALNGHEVVGNQQLLELMAVVKPVMALANTGQAHVLLPKSAGQQHYHSPDPEAFDKGW